MSAKYLFRSFAFLALFLAFAGCASTPPAIFLETPLKERIPGDLLAEIDKPPIGDITQQSGVARFVVEQDTALNVCIGRIDALRSIVEGEVQ